MAYPNGTSKIPYRPYIDGLRGVAVIAVVLYHARLFSITGGFVGVDVFFVLSGFLITSIIVRDIQAGNFSLLQFWERRVRRIVPVLFVVIFGTCIASYFLILYPPESLNFGTTVIAQSVFTSNMLYMVTDNYFNQSARYSPLLHTWSLSVEEQFYIFFPSIVMGCLWLSRRKWTFLKLPAWLRHTTKELWTGHRMLLCCVAVLSLISFLINIWFADLAPSSLVRGVTYSTAAFYLLPTRAWELGVGILVALSAIKIRSIVKSEMLSLAGLAAILGAVFFFNDTTLFPGVAALLPTLGTAAIIVANENSKTKMGALLSHPTLVWTGLVSYSLYLWHWPLFAFANLTSSDPLPVATRVVLIVVAVLVSWLSYTYIETPFRKKSIFLKRQTIFYVGFSALAVLAVSGFIIQRSSVTMMSRIPLAGREILLASAENVPWGGVCFQTSGDEVCKIGDSSPGMEPTFVVWGDSHAEALVPMLSTMGRSFKVQGAVFDGAFCIPIAGVHQLPPAPECEAESVAALLYIREHNIRHIILVARWNYYVRGGSPPSLSALITDSQNPSRSSAEATEVFGKSLTSMVDELSREGREITIVKQVPEQFGFNIRDAFYRAVHSGKGIGSEGVSIATHRAYQALAGSHIDSLTGVSGVQVIDPGTILCKNGICSLETNGKLIYRDEDHISTAGGISLEPLFRKVFGDIQASRMK